MERIASRTLSFAIMMVCAMTMQASAVFAAAPGGFEDLSEKLLPTVVNVSTTTKVTLGDGTQPMPNMPNFPPGSPFDQFFKDFYDRYRNTPETEQKTNAVGSGFVIDAKNGYIVTNNHVINGADEIKITLQDNTTLDAELVGTDEKTDIAVLKVKEPKGLTAATWGDSDKARVGSWIIAIGNPFGLGGTVTAGIVSARQRDINSGHYDDYIQTDASINRGNSGGPMFNMNGEVIGVNTAIFSPSGGSVGIGFAVPSAMAQGVVEQLIKYGQTKRGWIGVRIQGVTPEIAESLGLGKPRGALVSSVTEDGPSEKAGIKTGDVILKFNGKDVEEMRHLPRIVAETEIGKTAPVTIWRKNKEMQISITLGQLEKAEEKGLIETAAQSTGKTDDATKIEALGLSLSALTDSLRKIHGIPDTTNGAVVTALEKNSPAAEKGVMLGDVVSEVDQQEIKTAKDVEDKVKAALKEGRSSVLLFISRKGDMRFIAVKLEKK